MERKSGSRANFPLFFEICKIPTRSFGAAYIIFYPSAECIVNQYIVLWLKGKSSK